MGNRFVLRARLVQKDQLRRTPAGVAVLTFIVSHQSFQQEAGLPREVSLDVECIAIGDVGERLDPLELGVELELTGFIAAKSRKSRVLVMHTTEFERK